MAELSDADFAKIGENMAADLRNIDAAIDRLHAENRRMRALLAQAALFIACQQPNRFREKWLKDVEELCNAV